MDVEAGKAGLKYRVLDSTKSTDYRLPPFRTMELAVQIEKQGKLAKAEDPLGSITVTQDQEKFCIDGGDEEDKLMGLVDAVERLDPDLVLTQGGDSFLFTYLAQRANVNGVLGKLLLSRDPMQLAVHSKQGRTFFRMDARSLRRQLAACLDAYT